MPGNRQQKVEQQEDGHYDIEGLLDVFGDGEKADKQASYDGDYQQNDEQNEEAHTMRQSNAVEQTAEEPEKFIVEVWDGISHTVAMQGVMKVMNLGKISETAKGKQYCFCTVVRNIEPPNLKVFVVKNDKSERFIIQKDDV